MKRLMMAVIAGAIGLTACASGKHENPPVTTLSPSATASSPAATPGLTVGTWQRLPAAPITAGTGGPISVWTGTEMLIYGSNTTLDVRASTAGAGYNPTTDSWRKLPDIPATHGGFEGHNTAVWTGSEMLVWGIVNAAFDPATNAWRMLPDPPAAGAGPSVIVWTGTQVIGWGGGCCGEYDASGAAYTPATDSWEKLPDATLAGRVTSGAWTGKELIIAGGNDADGKVFADSAAYDPVTRSWRRLPSLPEPRTGATATWDGTEVLFVGGRRGFGGGARLYADGVAYDPSTNSWRRLPAMEFSRIGHVAEWTATQLLVWGGATEGPSGDVTPSHGVAYDPVTDTWSPLPKSPLRGRSGPTAVWTGKAMIVWGGSSVGTHPTKLFADGAVYSPGTA